MDRCGRSDHHQNNPEESRDFSEAVKRSCWDKAELLLGRDPDRWRKDPAGNAVCAELHGAQGLHGFEFAHILPYAKGGKSSIDNCQVLQTYVYRAKRDEYPFDVEEMRRASPVLVFNDAEEMRRASPVPVFNEQQLDVIEMCIYGDVKRPGRLCHALTHDQKAGKAKILGSLPVYGHKNEFDEYVTKDKGDKAGGPMMNLQKPNEEH